MINIMKLSKIASIFLVIAVAAACDKSGTTPEPTPDKDTVVTGIEPILPSHELRGAWVATVSGIDWPQAKYDETSQKALYVKYLDTFQSMNINAVFFQVRPNADAYYDSSYEPWSKYITGTAGKNPGYDVLKFLIDEAHKRNIQFHAWINPYRIASRSSATAAFPDLDSRIPVSMVKDYQKIRVYNPALPEVRQRLSDIVADLIERYDVDGIHMDDYFYPSLQSGESMGDDAEFAKYGASFASVKDFRRNNVFLMVQSIRNTIAAKRPGVIFTISPQGNYDNNYNTQYIDVPACCKDKLMDAVIPQLYWSTLGSTDYFTPRLTWWSSNIYSTPLMVGYAAYRFDGSTSNLNSGFTSSSELNTEMNLAAAKSNVVGAVFYNTSALIADKMGIVSVIRNHYKNPAIPPVFGKSSIVPSKPTDLKSNSFNLSWTAVVNAERYAIYRSNGDKKVASLAGFSTTPSYNVSSKGTYFVTALDAANAESPYSNLVICQ